MGTVYIKDKRKKVTCGKALGASSSSKSLVKNVMPVKDEIYKSALAKQGIEQKRSSRRFLEVEKPSDFDLTEEKNKVLDILKNTNENVFLTGKAGTGKSKFLKYFRATTKKNVVVLAHTGVAAVNVQGQTIYSFFGFHPKTTIDSIRKVWGGDVRIYQEIDVIVIDEISMVRADLLDWVDKFMRLNGPHQDKHFGGVQVFVIGDLFQLPPVVKEDEEKFFKQVYKSPLFFDSKVYHEANFIEKELTEVYRQNKEEQTDFINALDNLRICSFSQNDLDLINTRFDLNYTRSEDQSVISLVSTNKMADSINMVELSRLSAESYTYKGIITGDFKENSLPTAMELVLKKGAQVMLLNNDPFHRWVNGDIVTIVKTDSSSVKVLFDDDTLEEIGCYEWDSIRFIFDEETQKIKPGSEGKFIQLPIKLAWAVTIHKGQGKTFDKVHIDFGNGTFASGQAYVALSRSRKLEGIVLTSLLRARYVFVDDRVKEFMHKKMSK